MDVDGTKDFNHPILSDAYPSTRRGGGILYTFVLASGVWMFVFKLPCFMLRSNHRSNNTSMITGNHTGTSTIFHFFNSPASVPIQCSTSCEMDKLSIFLAKAKPSSTPQSWLVNPSSFLLLKGIAPEILSSPVHEFPPHYWFISITIWYIPFFFSFWLLPQFFSFALPPNSMKGHSMLLVSNSYDHSPNHSN